MSRKTKARNYDMVEEEIKRGDFITLPNGHAVIRNTFVRDFKIADLFGNDAIEDTYKRSFDCYKDDIRYLTALYLAINWQGFEWYEKDEERARLYFNLQNKLDAFILDGEDTPGSEDAPEGYKYKNFNKEEVAYFIGATD